MLNKNFIELSQKHQDHLMNCTGDSYAESKGELEDRIEKYEDDISNLEKKN